MNWLLHNVVADLYGPYFLAFYAMAIVAVIVACYRSVRSVDRTDGLDIPKIPSKLDPYEIAYLRGGEKEIVRVAVASLIQRGLLRVVEKKTWVAKTKKIERGRRPQQAELSPIEAVVLKWEGFPAEPHSLFGPSGITPLLEPTTGSYEAKCAEKSLLAPPEMKELGLRLFWLGTSIIVALGGYKLVVALINGHTNVLLLLIFGGVGASILGATCMRGPRLSRLGKAYLERLQTAYINLKDQLKTDGKLAQAWDDVSEERSRGKREVAINHSDCLLMVGIFGVASLADTPLADLKTMFAQGAASSGGGCGAGCGGGGGCGGGAVAAAVVGAEAELMSRELPVLGVGVGYREPFRTELFRHRDRVDFLEITADHYFEASPAKRSELELLADHFTIIPHGLDLSLGSAEGLDDDYLAMMAELVNGLDPPWWSEHIAFTRAGGVAIGHLAPLPWTREAVDVVAHNVEKARRRIRTP